MHCYRLAALIGTLLMISSCTSTPAPTTKPAEVTDVPAEVELIPTIELVPVHYRHRLVQQLSLAEDNQQIWLKAIVAAPPAHREAMAYLLNNMPESDLKKLTGDFLLKNVELAYKTREQSAWAAAIPLEIFFSDVLPYSNVDEVREDWRQDYYDRFMPLVKDAKSASEAVMILNKKVFPIVKVKYHATKREKPNQSPSESMKIGFASCTGLAIILSDACKAVGVPARLAGTPLWSDKSGNHTWTEIWDKQWYFVGAAEPGPLNKTWFVENAAKADESQPLMRIYAASFEQTSTVFPLVWDESQSDVHAVDVTRYYTGRQTLTVTLRVNTSVEVRDNGVLVAASSDASNTFTLPSGRDYTVNHLDSAGKIIDSRTVSLPATGGAIADFK